jgi:ParB-like chromosome segregation protein Spo0J
MAKASVNPTIKVEQWEIGRVLPYAGNAKIHPDLQVAQLAASMQQFGFVNPVLVDAKGVLVAGHGRLLAAQSLGMKKVPVIKLGHLSEDQAKALRLADNSIPQGGRWNPDLLEAELAHLTSIKFDLEPLGLDNIDLQEIEDQVTTPAAPRTNRTKTTIFLSVRNEDVSKARKVVVAALDKAKIPHNL